MEKNYLLMYIMLIIILWNKIVIKQTSYFRILLWWENNLKQTSIVSQPLSLRGQVEPTSQASIFGEQIVIRTQNKCNFSLSFTSINKGGFFLDKKYENFCWVSTCTVCEIFCHLKSSRPSFQFFSNFSNISFFFLYKIEQYKVETNH